MAVALPMESNPDTMNKYLYKLGVSNKWRMVDVIGLEGKALEWVPRPVLAVLLLFPLSDVYEEHRLEQEQEIMSKKRETSMDVFHLKQVLSNVCGTIALVHSVANNTHHIEVNDGLLKTYLNDAKEMDAAGRGALLENSTAILEAYKDLMRSESEEVDDTDPVNNHFITFIHKHGRLYELDGRKSFPIDHGPTTEDKLLEDAASVSRTFIDREPNNIGFNVMALVPAIS